MKFTSIVDEARLALGGVADFATGLTSPKLRLGVTGLSRAGKTVFITALVHTLIHGGRLPVFTASAEGRINRVYLEPQPDVDIPRFAYEDHIEALTGPDRHWPQSTRRISELRLTIDYAPDRLLARSVHGGMLHIDIVDYPGEWLLDLPLLDQSYAEWSAATIKASESGTRKDQAGAWRAHLASLAPENPADEQDAVQAAKLFTAYLAACRSEANGLSSLPPGRFLMPGDLEGSPLLTFAPLAIDADGRAPSGSLRAMMEERYRAYVRHIVKPFFYDHFARLDRQIVLVDVLSALNAGPDAVADLRTALTSVLGCFRQGANSLASQLFGRRIERVLFAATKADQLHHTSHDRLQDVLKLVIEQAARRVEFAGARYDAIAMAAIRATREATVRQGPEELPCIVGIPKVGETIGGETFDGETEAAIFPGDLPRDPHAALDGSLTGALKFVRFRPPPMERPKPLVPHPVFPQIRLDRAIEFLAGDSLQ